MLGDQIEADGPPEGRPEAPGMETADCPLCGTNLPQPVHKIADWQHSLTTPFTMARCGKCGLHYLNPRPGASDMTRHYPREYEAYRRGTLESGPWWARAVRLYGLDKRCRAVTRLVSSGRLLDVGCATGDFLARMRRYGSWELTGIEQDGQAASLARQRYGLEIYSGPMDEVSLASRHFDVVTLWDVVEHVRQPAASLRRIGEWLRPGGWLLVRTPDICSPYAQAFGHYWAGLDAPRHLTVFSPALLERMLTENGFRVSHIWTLSGSHAVTALSLRYWLAAHNMSQAWSRPLDNPIAHVLTAPIFWLIDRRGGALMTVAARQET